jgi:hypothetical protein
LRLCGRYSEFYFAPFAFFAAKLLLIDLQHDFLPVPRLRSAHDGIQHSVAAHRVIEVGQIGMSVRAGAYRFGKLDPHLAHLVGGTVAQGFPGSSTGSDLRKTLIQHAKIAE